MPRQRGAWPRAIEMVHSRSLGGIPASDSPMMVGASGLGILIEAVGLHRGNILQKSGLRATSELTRHSIQRGLVPFPKLSWIANIRRT
jgi:hypothetical protein